MNKYIISIILILAISTNMVKSIDNLPVATFNAGNYTIADIKSIFKGIIFGLNGQSDFGNSVECLENLEQSGYQFQQGIELIRGKNISAVLEGLKLIGRSIQTLPSALAKCKSGSADKVKSLKNLIGSFTNPLAFIIHVGKDIIINGVQIKTEIDETVASYNQIPRDYYGVGMNLGQALRLIFVGSPAQLQFLAYKNEFTMDDLKNVFRGVLYGIGEKAGLESALECVNQVKQEASQIEQAIAYLLQRKNEQKTILGIELIGESLQQLPQALRNCQASEASIQKLITMIKSFTSPSNYLVHFEKDLYINGVQIINEIKSAVGSYQLNPRDYYGFGINIGEALELVFVGSRVKKTSVVEKLLKQ